MSYIPKSYISHVRSYKGLWGSNTVKLKSHECTMMVLRAKSKQKKIKLRREEDKDSDQDGNDAHGSDDDDDDDDGIIQVKEKGVEVKTCSLTSLRTDVILKTALGYNRKKVEKFFYENRLRINGKMINKKSINANAGDEIDMIKGVAQQNSDFLNIGRVEVLNIEYDKESENVFVKLKLTKNILVENYPNGHPWKTSEN